MQLLRVRQNFAMHSGLTLPASIQFLSKWWRTAHKPCAHSVRHLFMDCLGFFSVLSFIFVDYRRIIPLVGYRNGKKYLISMTAIIPVTLTSMRFAINLLLLKAGQWSSVAYSLQIQLAFRGMGYAFSSTTCTALCRRFSNTPSKQAINLDAFIYACGESSIPRINYQNGGKGAGYDIVGSHQILFFQTF